MSVRHGQAAFYFARTKLFNPITIFHLSKTLFNKNLPSSCANYRIFNTDKPAKEKNKTKFNKIYMEFYCS
jgi:hypothetical protein